MVGAAAASVVSDGMVRPGNKRCADDSADARDFRFLIRDYGHTGALEESQFKVYGSRGSRLFFHQTDLQRETARIFDGGRFASGIFYDSVIDDRKSHNRRNDSSFFSADDSYLLHLLPVSVQPLFGFGICGVFSGASLDWCMDANHIRRKNLSGGCYTGMVRYLWNGRVIFDLYSQPSAAGRMGGSTNSRVEQEWRID